MLTVALEREPLRVDAAADGVEALEKIARNSYAVLLVDLMLPHMNGFELLEAMRNLKLAAPPVVIVMSAYDDAVLRRLDSQVGHACIRKPFDVVMVTALGRDCAELMTGGRDGDSADQRTGSAAPLH